ncbi:MAG: cytochrome C oxidase subunit IV family protein [Nitrososphaerales archaeon]
MKTSTVVGVWAYMLLAVIAEVVSFYYVKTFAVQTTVILTLAMSQAVAVAVFYMQLKDEPGSIRLFALVGMMFLSALLIAMVASLG